MAVRMLPAAETLRMAADPAEAAERLRMTESIQTAVDACIRGQREAVMNNILGAAAAYQQGLAIYPPMRVNYYLLRDAVMDLFRSRRRDDATRASRTVRRHRWRSSTAPTRPCE
ncbi:MAG: hypothetical protein JO079_11475 [Frankiaceae bacterium]|nr:hypothetical protein [Frankiaceae bacterium]